MLAHFLLLSVIAVVPQIAHATLPTAKTFFKSSNAPLWLSPETRPFHYLQKPSDHAVQSGLSVTAFYSHSNDKKRLGNYFGFYDDTTEAVYPHIAVTADEAVAASLRPQDIVHDVAHANDPFNLATNPLAETITFNPFIEQYGVVLNNALHINKWITIHTIMPWMQRNHVLGLKSTQITKAPVEEKLVSVSDFFAGTVHQEEATNPNQQDRLLYGKVRNTQSCNGLADITLLCLLSPHIHDDVQLQLGPLVTIPTSNRAHGSYLFEPVLGTGSHTLLGGQCQATLQLAQIHAIKINARAAITARIGLASHEVRSPSFLFNYDGGTDAQFARYALGGKKNARRLFPLINMLTQMVSVKPGSTVECELGMTASYARSAVSLEYRFSYTGAETITPLCAWPSHTYALAKHTYSQTTTNDHGVVTGYRTFTIAQDSDLLNNADLSENALNFMASATPSQKTHLIGVSFHCAPAAQLPYTGLHLRGYYAWSLRTGFGIGEYGISCSLSHSF